jgi:hypothetical protein
VNDRGTLVFVKQGGQRKIVSAHFSAMPRAEGPHASIDFASYGAALDNTPEVELADPKGTSADTGLLVPKR